jgi:hypothetical protein
MYFKRTEASQIPKEKEKEINELIEGIRKKYKDQGLTGKELESKANREIYRLMSQTAPYIHPDAINTIFNYAKYIVYKVVPDSNYTVYDTDLMYNIKTFEETLQSNQSVIKPQDRGFTDDQDNITLNTILWVLCGILDWLDKDHIEIKDYVVLKQMLLGNISAETTETIDEYEFESAATKISEAILQSQLYANPEVVRNLTTTFFTLQKIRSIVDKKLTSEEAKNKMLDKYLFISRQDLEKDNSNEGKLYKYYHISSCIKQLNHYVL